VKVYFVGAGPGDPELITVRGKRLLEGAEVVIYAGSLVNPAVLQYAAKASLYDSSALTLEEIVDLMERSVAQGKTVVRLHSGDPTVYGAIQEQIERLEERGIPYEIVPGVSSFTSAAAVLGKELTSPGLSQTVILTRAAGRTPVPEAESLASLAGHRCTLCLFLSSRRLKEAARELAQGYGEDAPAALVYRASWPDQKVLVGTLKDLPSAARAQGIDRTALLLVGGFLSVKGRRSKLYHPDFYHGFRRDADAAPGDCIPDPAGAKDGRED
jgi:precorrin-4/cobalt-precorrin-4 C11-methyltransferase